METPEIPDLVIGKIIFVNKSTENGGYGFITCKEIPFTRIFFHWSALDIETIPFLELEEGMEVEFKPINVEGKWRAIKIDVLESDDSSDETNNS